MLYRRFTAFLILFLAIPATLCLPEAFCQGTKTKEYEAKAAFIYNLAKFIEWPPALQERSTLKVCVIGVDPFGHYLDQLKDITVKERRITLERISSIQEIKGCDIIFISRSEADHLEEILREATRGNILTIGDTSDFAHRGVMINFFIDEEKIRFEVNLEAAKKSGISISSKVLKLAKIIKGQ